jgi:hypothetical protein
MANVIIMKHKSTITILSLLLVILSAIAAAMGIFSTGGPGPYPYQSIRGKEILIHGKGLYQHMSAEVAPQGIAQDYVTLFIGIPVLLFALLLAHKGSLAGRYLLAGTLGYFLVTYLFYTVMGMYNQLFLVYVALMGCSFFGFVLTLLSFDTITLRGHFGADTPIKTIGGFLIFNACAIGLLWLSIVVPPLVDGSVVPIQAEHYTTLIVQGLDLGILLPAAFVTGILLLRKRSIGYLLHLSILFSCRC